MYICAAIGRSLSYFTAAVLRKFLKYTIIKHEERIKCKEKDFKHNLTRGTTLIQFTFFVNQGAAPVIFFP